MAPIGFQGQGSKVKVKCYTLLLNLVNIIQTEPFQLGPSNLEHILLMTRRHLLVFKVKGQGHMLDVVFKPCKHDKDRIVWVRTVKYNTCYMVRGRHPLLFKVNVKVKFGPLARGCRAWRCLVKYFSFVCKVHLCHLN